MHRTAGLEIGLGFTSLRHLQTLAEAFHAAWPHVESLSHPSSGGCQDCYEVGAAGPSMLRALARVSPASRHTCRSSCPLAGNQGCYAEAGFLTRLHWVRLSRGESGLAAAAFIKQVLALPAGILFRHCVVGCQWPDPADPLRID